MKVFYKTISIFTIILLHHVYEAQPRNFLKNPEIFFQILVDESNNFNNKVCKFPTKENRIAVIAGNDHARQQKIVEHAMDTYPLIHKNVFGLALN